MSHRDLFWYTAGAITACAGFGLWLFIAENRTSSLHDITLPAWHPAVSETAGASQARESQTTLAARAEQMRRERNYGAARNAYAELAASGQMTADAWADYADVVASAQNGNLSGEPAALIAAALQVNAAHPKALWLQASLAHQEQRYSDALVIWRRLRDVLPPDSPDRRIIEDNMQEATRLAGAKPADVLSISLGRQFD
jgi:hypothetical protein